MENEKTNKKCKGCGRPLNENEEDFCPACSSSKSYKKKKWTEVIVGVAVVVVGFAFVCLGGKGTDIDGV